MTEERKVKIGKAFRPIGDHSIRAFRPGGDAKPTDKPVTIGRPIIKPKPSTSQSGSNKPKGS